LVCVFRAEQNIEGHKIKNDGEPEAVITRWLITYDTELYQLKKTQLQPQCDKCIKFDGEYVEIQWNRSTVERCIFLLKLKKTKMHAF
jgi:hypothetical protein